MSSIWQECHKHGKYNNLAKFCRDKKTVQGLSQTIETDQSNESDDALFINAINKQGQSEIISDECFSMPNIQGTPLRFKIDTGSQANIIPVRMLKFHQGQPTVKKPAAKLTSYSG